MVCNHALAKDYYIEALLRPEGHPKFYQCDSDKQFASGGCNECDDDQSRCFMLGPDSAEDYNKLGFSQGKRFYLITTAEKPYFSKIANLKVDFQSSPISDAQMVFIIKFGSGVDRIQSFGLSPDCADDITVMFYAK